MTYTFPTIRDALQWAKACLEDSSDAPELDAQWLLLEVLGEDEASWLVAHDEVVLTEEQVERLEEMVARRETGEPLAYILGWWEFYGRRFVVTRDVLVPRPSTEALVDEALQYIDILEREGRRGVGREIVVADVGTGSGCVAITLLKECNRVVQSKKYDVRVVATDISEVALEVARENAERHGVADRVTFLQGDMLEPLKDREVDLVVSNPPYVPTGELGGPNFASIEASLGKPETVGLRFEPRMALDGGADGERYVRELAQSPVARVVEGVGGVVTVTRPG